MLLVLRRNAITDEDGFAGQDRDAITLQLGEPGNVAVRRQDMGRVRKTSAAMASLGSREVGARQRSRDRVDAKDLPQSILISVVNSGQMNSENGRATNFRLGGCGYRENQRELWTMSRNIVLCCDGTANEFAVDRTNVVKLFAVLDADRTRQVAYYHPGLGTMEPPGALTRVTRTATRLLGKAFGYGLESDIRDAYVFLMNNYEDGDCLFMFGFSRGAYTVRAVASLVHTYGLIGKGNEPLVPYAIRMLMAIQNIPTKAEERTAEEERYFKLADDFKRTFCTRTCRPKFVGVWDTVSSVGWYENPLRLPYSADNPDIEIGRHAISLDERRAFFRSNLWMPKNPPPRGGPKDLKQVWFPGVHCDVGGGYPEAESGLSKIALEWMLKEAIAAGLLVDPAKMALVLGQRGDEYVRPNAKADAHEFAHSLVVAG